jgi:hypothetical protein
VGCQYPHSLLHIVFPKDYHTFLIFISLYGLNFLEIFYIIEFKSQSYPE